MCFCVKARSPGQSSGMSANPYRWPIWQIWRNGKGPAFAKRRTRHSDVKWFSFVPQVSRRFSGEVCDFVRLLSGASSLFPFPYARLKFILDSQISACVAARISRHSLCSDAGSRYLWLWPSSAIASPWKVAASWKTDASLLEEIARVRWQAVIYKRRRTAYRLHR